MHMSIHDVSEMRAESYNLTDSKRKALTIYVTDSKGNRVEINLFSSDCQTDPDEFMAELNRFLFN